MSFSVVGKLHFVNTAFTKSNSNVASLGVDKLFYDT